MNIIVIPCSISLLLSVASCGTPANSSPWSAQIAESFMARHPDGIMQVEGNRHGLVV